ncbi:IS256 family transposase [Streptomyces rhizosphaerihabitans]|uniref:IS256 family transposase n=1 Tax=Streptomyces rhizosphaerihabitans TaxID=1266770 RepID=UPI0021BEF187|nr:IS256 family transposase [Streptomyces rhizosphaerihabitans]
MERCRHSRACEALRNFRTETAGCVQDNLTAASPDLLRAMVKTFAGALMSAEADALCNAEYGQVSDERVNHRNGYRPREWDTRAGTVELAIPKLRQGSYFPHWLLERRRRAEQALVSVVATAYLPGVSTRRVEKLAESLGVTQLSKSQVSSMAKHLDEQVAAFRNRPLDAGPYAFVRVDALTQKVREGGRIINVHALIAVGVNADGHREILGIDVATAEDGADWLAFLRSLTARGLNGVQLVVSDAHTGLVAAIGAVLPGASWQRCRTQYARNLLSQVPKSAQPWVATLLRTVFEQPDTKAIQSQMRHVLDALEAKFPKAAAHLDAAQPQQLHLVTGDAVGSLLHPEGLAPVPEDSSGSHGGIFIANPALDLRVESERREQVDNWMQQLGLDAGLIGMEALIDRIRATPSDSVPAR